MNDFKVVRGGEGNEIIVEQGCKVSPEATVEFRKFFNGTGGVGNRLIIGEGCSVKKTSITFRGINNVVEIGAGSAYLGAIDIVGNGMRISIGKNCTINGLAINCRDQDIVIGDECLFSSGVRIRSSDVHKIFDIDSGELLNKPMFPVEIGEHVWVGQGVFLGKNASIPSGCVVGAGAVITKRFNKPNCIIGGVGGAILRENIRWEK